MLWYTYTKDRQLPKQWSGSAQKAFDVKHQTHHDIVGQSQVAAGNSDRILKKGMNTASVIIYKVPM